MKKIWKISLVILFVVFLISSCSGNKETQQENDNYYQNFIENANKIFETNIPYGKVEYYIDNQGGFHGDGDIVMIIGLNSDENNIFSKSIDKKWMKVDDNEDIAMYLWGLDNSFDKSSIGGGMLDKNIKPKSDTKYKIYDLNNKKMNNKINLKNLFDFWFVAYSESEEKIYIQNSFF